MDSQSNSTNLPTFSIAAAKTVKMSSREIAELTRKKHQHVKRDIEKLLTDLAEDASKFGHIYFDSMNREQTEYLLDRDLTENLLLGYSPSLRRAVLARMREMEALLSEPRIPTTAEAFVSAFQMLANQERRHVQQAAAISAIGDKIERIEHAQTVLSSRPANSEGITHLKDRIHRMFGLSAETIDDVMRQSPYAPKPAGTVKNLHENADGSTYTVWWKKDVTATFRRFVDECQQVTATLCTHPYLSGRFKLIKQKP